MKRIAVVLGLATLLLLPGVARAGSSTDAALGLGAFAVFNQLMSGTGVFGAFAPPQSRTVIVERHVVVEYPAPVVVYPAPVVIAPRPVAVYAVPVYGHGYRYGYYKHAGHWRHDR